MNILEHYKKLFGGEPDAVFSGFSNIDDDFYEEIEEILIMGDIGVRATNDILEKLRKQVKEKPLLVVGGVFYIIFWYIFYIISFSIRFSIFYRLLI